MVHRGFRKCALYHKVVSKMSTGYQLVTIEPNLYKTHSMKLYLPNKVLLHTSLIRISTCILRNIYMKYSEYL